MSFRIDTKQLRAKLKKIQEQVQANEFKPDLMMFVWQSLSTAARETPERSYDLIRKNQRRQYLARINCIPSAHTVVDPSLRVKADGTQWLYYRGKWIIANRGYKLSGGAWSAFQSLMAERSRRMQVTQQDFVEGRAQARFLYRKSWTQIANSLGIGIATAARTSSAYSRHQPPKDPPRGYGQLRGGKRVISVSISNPFLEQPSRYKPFSGKTILAGAMEVHRPAFERRVQTRANRLINAIMNSQ